MDTVRHGYSAEQEFLPLARHGSDKRDGCRRATEKEQPLAPKHVFCTALNRRFCTAAKCGFYTDG